MLIDDDEDDNFIHERIITQCGLTEKVVIKQTGKAALEYLRLKKESEAAPDLIFLDINMPAMNGWEFLEEYNKLDEEQKGKAIIVMLSTSTNPKDLKKAADMNFVSGYRTKPLTVEMLQEIVGEYFAGELA
jgi:CheY-like chemotaxis protein